MTDELPITDAPYSTQTTHIEATIAPSPINGRGENVPRENDFKQEMITGLEQIRLRLLDLTFRNKLLNLPYNVCLPIIDAVPDLIFRKLRDSEELVFRSLPPTVPGVRTASTSDELPKHNAGSPEWRQHQGRDYVQAKLETTPLINRLTRIRTATRSMMDEMGVSTLYLIFGFLEWREAGGANATHAAPLILFPISLRSGHGAEQSTAIPYYFKYSEEEIEANLTLRAKLRNDFGIELPAFGENDTPESYFDQVRRLIEPQQNWKIRREMVIANLSFHKFRMWQDLDPKAWEGQKFLEHPILRDFIIGRPVGNHFASEDYDLDTPSVQASLPPLIEDADSSQHSALLDAIKGNNLVIEGPPGTGKSQTITNLIAAAMAQGKTVLFVAEKKAALDVVEARLKRAGLGAFCLELHGNQVRTNQVAHALQQRLSQKGRFERPGKIQEKKRQLEADKKRLIEYVETVNQAFGNCGQRLQEIIGCRERLRNGFSFDLSQIETITLPDAESLTLPDVYRLEESARFFAAHLGLILSRGELRSHPWNGLGNHQFRPDDERALFSALGEMRNALSAIMVQLDSIRVEMGIHGEDRDALLDEMLRIESKLPELSPEIRVDLLEPFAEPSHRRKARDVKANAEHYQEVRSNVALRLGPLPDLNLEQVRMLDRACQQAIEAGFGGKNIPDLRQELQWAQNFADYLTRTAGFIIKIETTLACPIPFDVEGVSLLLKAIPLVLEAPEEALPDRHPILEQEGVIAILLQAQAEAEKLRNREKEIAQKVDWNLAPPAERWAPHAVACANAGWLSPLAGEYRMARRDWRGMSRRARKATGLQMAEDFRTLIQYKQDLAAFTANEFYQERLGPLFQGVNTRFNELLALSRWYEAVRAKLGFIPAAAQPLAASLLAAPAGNLSALREFLRDHREEINRLERVFGNFQSHLARLPKAWRGDSLGNLGRFAERLRERAQALEEQLQGFDECGLQPSILMAEIPAQLKDVQKLFALREKIAAASETAFILGEASLLPETDFSVMTTTLGFIESLQKDSFFAQISRWMLVPEIEERLQRLRALSSRMKNAFEQYQSASTQFQTIAGFETQEWNPATAAGQRFPLATMQSKIESTVAAAHELPEWLHYRRNRKALLEAGLEKLVEQAEQGTLPLEATAEAAKFIYYNSLLRAALSRFPFLTQFSGSEHDEIRRRFAEIDREVIQLTRKEYAWKIDQQPVPEGNAMGLVNDYSELGLINHLISVPNARVKIRQLISRAGQALLALKPCFMLSPLTVAQFLPPGAVHFDLIIMDEASQLRPEDALGAIARGSQVVVVGDRMQLPPTNFFNAVLNGEAEEEEKLDSPIADVESILDLAVQRYKPTRMLKWHYRSRHESLIAFSNREFYNNDLLVFPSPSNAGELGLRFHYVEGGQYDQTRNQVEARRLVAAAISHLKASPTDSLGIVALNSRQSELIRDLLDHALGQDATAAEQYRKWEEAGEEVLVKNLETVQGDERDVIFLSATIGKNPQGQFPLTTLGALNNKSYGHRRLNVLITRARKRVEVFSSVEPEEIPVTETNSRGARALKGYLAYAKSGVLPLLEIAPGEPDSDFELMVAEALRKRGFDIRHQIGVASYRIDLGILHPQKPGSYMLGIECDGATYHSSRSARDRDRLRQSVLEGLGWNIHRIWSTDWFRNPAREIDRVVERIEQLTKG